MMSKFIARASTTLRTLCIYLPTAICFGRFDHHQQNHINMHGKVYRDGGPSLHS